VCSSDLLKEAKEQGLRIINGLEMLIGQAEMSFKIWTGEQYPFEVINKEMFYKNN